jgi:naphthoate synthase
MWTPLKTFTDIKLEKTSDGIAKITINRPEVRNTFRPLTVQELLQAFDIVHEDASEGVVILTGEGPDAFCSGGDQKVRGHAAAGQIPVGLNRMPVIGPQSPAFPS